MLFSYTVLRIYFEKKPDRIEQFRTRIWFQRGGLRMVGYIRGHQVIFSFIFLWNCDFYQSSRFLFLMPQVYIVIELFHEYINSKFQYPIREIHLRRIVYLFRILLKDQVCSLFVLHTKHFFLGLPTTLLPRCLQFTSGLTNISPFIIRSFKYIFFEF